MFKHSLIQNYSLQGTVYIYLAFREATTIGITRGPSKSNQRYSVREKKMAN